MSEPAPSLGRLCAFLSTALFLLALLAPAVAFASDGDVPATSVADGGRADYQPFAPKPNGDGPYTIGSVLDNVATSTKSYTVEVMIYYPANSSGTNTPANYSGAPYPTIVWLPGMGGVASSYGTFLSSMASWGFVVMAVGVNWTDWPLSANITDMEEYLDYLETRNATPGNRLQGLVDKEAFGLSGHSSGGGLTIVDGANVARIKAGLTFAAAIGEAAVDSVAPGWMNKKILTQVGETDSTYIAGSKRTWDKVNGTHAYVEVKGAGHQVWQNVPYIWHAFYMISLDGKNDYLPYIYGLDAVNDYIANAFVLKFWYNATHFFPPKVEGITATPNPVNMDDRVDLGATISGYYPPNHNSGAFQWDFENDGTYEQSAKDGPAANHTFTAPGTFNPKFKYTLGTLIVEPTAPLAIVVNNVDPVAVLGDDKKADEDVALQFDGTLSHDTLSDNATLQFKWDFGDGIRTEFGTNKSISHPYSKPGDFKVNLTVKDTHGAVASDELLVNITNVHPTAKAGDDVTVNEDVFVSLKGTGNDTASDMASLKFKWDFGDGNGTDWSSSTEAQAIYPWQGNYTVTLHVKDPHGAEASSTLVVHVQNVQPSVVLSGPDDGDEFGEDEPIEFTGMATDTASDTPSLQYMWDFGDGNGTDWSADPGATHTYTASGTYEVTLSAKDEDGAVASQDIAITITNDAPKAAIMEPSAGDKIVTDEPVSFGATGTDTPSDQALLTYVWTIDSQDIAGKEITYTFWTSGDHDVKLTVSDPEGEKAEVMMTIEVKAVPPTIKDFVVPTEDLQTGQAFNYSAVAMDSEEDLANITVLWSFGDGNTSTALSGTYTFAKAGTYKITLTIKDEDGETATMSQDVTVEGSGGGGGGDDGGGKKKSSPGFEPVLMMAAMVMALLVLTSRRRRQSS